ncbi:glycerophosphodiester phosphodiesterase [Streptococcus gallolyticus]|uniref:glycerophosphodiester phosphodiesterase n=1 Tax=Streptococcus gallolyticus TaxID=315405 RepID=UPI00228485B7|nr:glycerophosphodiester phosphodiesterase [Streptococcus gallolyticus]MCY7184607.1 glycerophosphodiester phosphodiesterase [Streptococcus gallolyticus subsp. gallolyticus]MCY7188795.1 glycerophosphodiester phosphodiesterase [Streptococcus gallolyticus subsp. gallolyticus]
MRKDMVAVLKDLYRHKYTYILRATILQLLITTVGAYVLSLLIRVVLVGSDIPGMTTDNIFSFLTNPLTLSVLVIYLFLLAFLVYLEFSLLVEIIRHKEAKLRLTWTRLKEDAIDFFKAISGWHFLAFLVYLVLTIPFLNVMFSSALLENLYIPKFISGELLKTTNGKLLYYGLYLVLGYLNLRFLYTLPLTVTGKGERFGRNMATSWQLTRGKKIFKLFGLAIVLISVIAVVAVFSFLGISLAALVDGADKSFWVETLFLSFVWGVLFAGRLLFKLASISYLLQVTENSSSTLAPANQGKRRHRLLALTGLILVIGGINYIYNVLKVSGEPVEHLEVIAHRGMVSQGVENSLEALEGAANAGADYAEMDIILSKDQQFIVSHDDNLKRLTGKDIMISQSNAKDVIGLKTSQNGYQSQIVSFEDYVAKAKQLGIKLLVELKPTGNEPANYEQLFVDKMKELGVEKSYMTMSADLKTIETVEKLDPTIKTGYTISLQIGNFTSQKVDFYAIEDFSYNELLARTAHKNGKKIYVWTINSTDDIEKYVETSTDGIITDYPDLVSDIEVYLANDNSYLDYFLRLTNLSWIENL